jgi:cytochrome b6-f complex iron-sulfur subunit
MTRKDFFAKVGFGAATVLIPACVVGIATSCSSDAATSGAAPQPVAAGNFTVDTSVGALSSNGGFIVINGIIIARTNSGSFLAFSSSCTHESVTLNYNSGGNQFVCPRHSSRFTSDGTVVSGPASRDLKQYQTSLSGTTLTVLV